MAITFEPIPVQSGQDSGIEFEPIPEATVEPQAIDFGGFEPIPEQSAPEPQLDFADVPEVTPPTPESINKFSERVGFDDEDPTKLSRLTRPPSRETTQPAVDIAPQPVSAEGAPKRKIFIRRVKDRVEPFLREKTFAPEQALGLATQVMDFLPAMLRGGKANAKKVIAKIAGEEAASKISFGEKIDDLIDASGRLREDAKQFLSEASRS